MERVQLWIIDLYNYYSATLVFNSQLTECLQHIGRNFTVDTSATLIGQKPNDWELADAADVEILSDLADNCVVLQRMKDDFTTEQSNLRTTVATVVQEVEKSFSNQKVASSIPCQSVLEQDTEPQCSVPSV